jgi:hypothetical protein
MIDVDLEARPDLNQDADIVEADNGEKKSRKKSHRKSKKSSSARKSSKRRSSSKDKIASN